MAAGRPPAAARRSLPGIVATLVLWLVAGDVFGRYLAEFAYTYVTYYAGLASAMIALVFLYLIASIFIYGGELNAVDRGAARRKCSGGARLSDSAAAASITSSRSAAPGAAR